jgi:hypothetical protein
MAKLAKYLGGTIFVATMLQGIELEARIGINPQYASQSAVRQNLIAIHGRPFFVNALDFWRHEMIAYVLFLGALLFWLGSRNEEVK